MRSSANRRSRLASRSLSIRFSTASSWLMKNSRKARCTGPTLTHSRTRRHFGKPRIADCNSLAGLMKFGSRAAGMGRKDWPRKARQIGPSALRDGAPARASPAACTKREPQHACRSAQSVANHAAPHILFRRSFADLLAQAISVVVATLLRDTKQFCSKIFQSRLRPIFHLDALARAVAISTTRTRENYSPRHPRNDTRSARACLQFQRSSHCDLRATPGK